MRKLKNYLIIPIILVVLLYVVIERTRFNAIVIHHSGAGAGSYESIKEYHTRDKGWFDAAYHLILANGSAGVPAGFLEATSRYRYLMHSVATKNVYYNLRAVHLCIIGNYNEQEVPERLRPALAHALQQLQRKYGIPDDRILFHRDCNSTSCLGSFITRSKITQWLSAEASKCPDRIKQQHRQVIGWTW